MKRIIYKIITVILVALTLIFQCLKEKSEKGFQWEVDWGQPQGVMAYSTHSLSIWDPATVAVSLDLNDVHLVDVQVKWNSEYFYLVDSDPVNVSPVPFDIVLHRTNNVDYVAYGAVCKSGGQIDIDQNLLIIKIRAKKLGVTPVILSRSVAYSGYNESTNYLYQKSVAIINDTCYVTTVPQ